MYAYTHTHICTLTHTHKDTLASWTSSGARVKEAREDTVKAESSRGGERRGRGSLITSALLRPATNVLEWQGISQDNLITPYPLILVVVDASLLHNMHSAEGCIFSFVTCIHTCKGSFKKVHKRYYKKTSILLSHWIHKWRKTAVTGRSQHIQAGNQMNVTRTQLV